MSADTNAQNNLLIWLDNSEKSEQNDAYERSLRDINNNFGKFKNEGECEKFIKSNPVPAQITLIANGGLGREIVPKINQLSQIAAVYIFCLDQEKHKQWSSSYNKVKGVCVDFNQLQNKLQPSVNETIHRSIIIDPSRSKNASKKPKPNDAKYTLNGSYMISDFCLDYLSRSQWSSMGYSSFIDLCRTRSPQKSDLTPILQEFQENYGPGKAIFWLHKYPIFSEITTNIFQDSDIIAMHTCQFFLHHIRKQLEEHKCTSTITVYYSETVPNELFQQLQCLKGKVIAVKYYLWTSLDREKALSQTSNSSSSNDSKRILFTIEANPPTGNIKPFAKVGSLIESNDSDDVLFMIGSLFEITGIEEEKECIINIKMRPCEKDTESGSQEFFHQLKCQCNESNRETNIITFADLLLTIGSSIPSMDLLDKDEKLIAHHLDTLPDDHSERPYCYYILGRIDLRKGNLESSLNRFTKSLEIRRKTLQSDDSSLIETYKNLICVYWTRKDFKHAEEYLKQLIQSVKQLHGDNHIDLIFCYNSMAIIHENKEEIQEAISFFYQALAIMIKNKSTDNHSLAAVYNNLGQNHYRLKNYDLALGFYKTSLKIKLEFLGRVNFSTALTHKNIGLVYAFMNIVKEARNNFEEAEKIYHDLNPSDNTCIMEIQELIKELPTESD